MATYNNFRLFQCRFKVFSWLKMSKNNLSLDTFAQGSRLMESFSNCMEEQGKEYLRLKMEVTENEKAVIKLRVRHEQISAESDELKRKKETVKEKLINANINLGCNIISLPLSWCCIAIYRYILVVCSKALSEDWGVIILGAKYVARLL